MIGLSKDDGEAQIANWLCIKVQEPHCETQAWSLEVPRLPHPILTNFATMHEV
jgi:hypothetical protein